MGNNFFITFTLLFLFVGISSFSVDLKASGIVNYCSPAVKGNEYKLSGTIKHTIPEKMDLLWVKDKAPVSMCKSNMACYEYSDISTLSTIKQVTGDIFQYSITIKNVSYLDEGVWSLKYIGLASLRISDPLFSCTLNVYDILALTLHDCPEVVEEHQIVRCWCGTSNATEGNIQPFWFDAKGREIISNENWISFNATRQNSGYLCRGQTLNGQKVVPVNYKPLIVAKAGSIKCANNYTKTEWKTICTIDRIYPQAVCSFDIEVDGNNDSNIVMEKNLEPELNSIEYSHEYAENDQLYFKSVCALTLPVLCLLCNYTLVVNINPNVTGSDRDSKYAVKTSISGFFVPLNEEEEPNYSDSELKLMLVIVCVALILLILVVALFVILKVTLRQITYEQGYNKDAGLYTMIDTTESNQFVKRDLNDKILFYKEDLEKENHFNKAYNNT